eukprot:15030831-Ditylum_brightwellii.AAC.1
MATQLYSTCVLQRSPFHAASDVLHNIDVNIPLNPFHWKSAMTTSINDTTKAVLQSAAQVDELPAYAFDLATLPAYQNGLGLYNPSISLIT